MSETSQRPKVGRGYPRAVTVGRLRVATIALFGAAAVLSALAGDEGGPFLAGAVACFSIGIIVFFRWRREQRARVLAQEAKTAEEIER